MKTEYTSPEWQLWDQKQLAPYRNTTLSRAKCTAKKTYNVLTTQVAPEAVGLLKTVLSNMAKLYGIITHEDMIGSIMVVGAVFFAFFVAAMGKIYFTTDYMLDRSLAINAEVASILQNVSVRDMPLRRIAEEASDAEAMIQNIVISRLTNRIPILDQFHKERDALNSLVKEIETLWFQVQWLGMDIHTSHEEALFYLRHRPDLPWWRWHRYVLQTRTPTLKEIRRGLVDDTLKLSDKLDLRIDVADSIWMHAAALARQLERTELQLLRSQHTHEDTLRSLGNESSYLWWPAAWSTNSKVLAAVARDIETAEQARNHTRVVQDFIVASAAPLRAVQDDLRRARASLRVLVDPESFLRLKVYFWTRIHPEQEAAVEQIVELTSFFNAAPQHPSDSDYR
ncbi:hypothetical protein PG984_009536 [Apiospora sp. TS-2023a]